MLKQLGDHRSDAAEVAGAEFAFQARGNARHRD